MIDLEGKVAVVTGGASGIGEASVRTMAKLGASVVIGDVDEAGSASIVKELSSAGCKVSFCGTDVMCEEQVDALMRSAADRYGGLDILHHSAGIPRTIAPDCEIIDIPVEWWNKTIAGHLTSTMLASKHALPHMIQRGGGAIVNTSSAGGLAATVDIPAYGAAKSGIHQLTRDVAATYGRDNIRCNVVVPGPVLTPRGRATLTPEMFELFATETPLPRLAVAQDIANVVVFLASDLSGMITGQTISADGGLMIKLPYWLPKMRARQGKNFDATTFKMPAD